MYGIFSRAVRYTVQLYRSGVRTLVWHIHSQFYIQYYRSTANSRALRMLYNCVPQRRVRTLVRHVTEQIRHGFAVVRPSDRFRKHHGHVDDAQLVTDLHVRLLRHRICHNHSLKYEHFESYEKMFRIVDHL